MNSKGMGGANIGWVGLRKGLSLSVVTCLHSLSVHFDRVEKGRNLCHENDQGWSFLKKRR